MQVQTNFTEGFLFHASADWLHVVASYPSSLRIMFLPTSDLLERCLCFFQPDADLLGLFQVLIIVFGEDPPVYSKVAAPTTQDGNTPCSPPGRQSPSTQAVEPPHSNTDDELQQNVASLLSVVRQLQLDNDEKDARIKVLEAKIDDLQQYSHIDDDVSIVNGWLQ